MALLIVLYAAPANAQEADCALTALRRMLPRRGGAAAVLLCDLPDAPHLRMPQDALLVRRLQSGVMRIERGRPGRAMLLVRRRTWDDAGRLYLGRGQAQSPRQVVSQLLTQGRADASFDAASVSPRSLCGRYDAVLMTDASLACAPDVPPRMLARLRRSACGCVLAPVLYDAPEAEPLVGRLLRQGFSLTPLLPERDPFPLMATPRALGELPEAPPVAADCPFLARTMPDMAALMARARAAFLHSGSAFPALYPALELAALLLAAASGSAVLAVLALLLPEADALRHPARLPGALVRLALLPALAASSLEAWLARLLARSPALRPALPDILKTPRCCVAFGALLLVLAVAGVGALVPLTPAALLWLFASVIVRALDSPVRERIPLDGAEHIALRSEAEAAFSSLDKQDAASPALRMLADCGACLLGLLEPDEAARRVQARLGSLAQELAAPAHSALHHAAALAAAQLLRERMGQCDAALRPLPGELDALVLSAPAPQGSSLLSRFLRAALFEDSAPLLAPGSGDDPADALFLPPRLLRTGEPPPALLPITHPHTCLARLALPAAHPQALRKETLLGLSAEERVLWFLSLTDALLDRPFAALLARSPITAPLLPALAARPADMPEGRYSVRTRRIRPHAAPQ